MKKITLLLLIMLAIGSCKKTPVEKPEIDFSAATYYTPNDIDAYKNEVSCTENPYWEGKTIKLQGFALQRYIDTVNRVFVLFSTQNSSDTSNAYLRISYVALKGNTQIATLLTANKDKHCFLSARCSDDDYFTNGCVRAIKYTIQNPEDLVFK